MSTVTFDTLELVTELKQAGIPQDQAEAVVRTIVKAHEGLVTAAHLDAKLEKELAPVRTDLAVIKWMVGVLIAVAVANFAKPFF